MAVEVHLPPSEVVPSARSTWVGVDRNFLETWNNTAVEDDEDDGEGAEDIHKEGTLDDVGKLLEISYPCFHPTCVLVVSLPQKIRRAC